MPSDRRFRVWIVEDNQLFRDSLRETVDREPDLVCALALESCEELFDALEAGDRPDLVLMDLSLPGAGGEEGIARLSAQVPDCDVLVLTVHDDDEHVFDAIRAGASGYLLKPSSPEEVIGAIRETRRGAAPLDAYIARRILRFFTRLPAAGRTDKEEYGLTPRETEILHLVVDGLDRPAIARRLGLSYHTVSNHLRNVYRKLHVTNRSQVVAKAIREGL